MSWRDQAACTSAGGIDWFPGSLREVNRSEAGRQNLARARSTCERCPVAHHCLLDALEEVDQYGIRAGYTEDQRRAMVVRRNGRPPQPINHGTDGGYQTHRRRGEEPCGACRVAHAETKDRHRKATG